MSDKPTALVLGGTFPHIELIKNLRRRGYYVILVDYYENPLAKEAADEHLRESTLDAEKVLNIARDRNAKLVISTCIDQANATACYIAEKLGLPAPYSYETALNVTNKVLMKKIMTENGIPTSQYCCLHDIKDYNGGKLKFPVIVKPADSNSSKGVKKACGYEELRRHVESALKISRRNEAIVEEYKDGREIGVDCFIKNNQATVLMTRERRKITAAGDQCQQIYGSIWPADITARTSDDLKQIATKIAQAFKLDNTPLMIQAIVNGDDINVIEFAPRIGGGENYRIIKLHTDFDIINAAIDSFLGIQAALDYKLPALYYADNYLYAKPGLFGNISGHERLLENKTLEYLNAYKKRGVEIGPDMSSNNRVGVFTVKADSKSELFKKIKTTIENIEVYDIHGQPIMRKDIY